MADIDFGTLLLQSILAVNPKIDISETSQFSELVVRVIRSYQAVLERLIARDDIVRDIRRFAEMTDSEIEALAANFFVTRKTGSSAVGSVTILYISPQDVIIPIGQQFFSTTGAQFIATAAVSLRQAQVITNYDAVRNAYRVDVPQVRSLGNGPGFSAKAGEIVSMANQPASVLLVTNESDFSQSVAGETKDQLAGRIIKSASQRNLCSADSATAFLLDDPRVTAVSVIGAGDVEMLRDIIYGVHANGKQDIYIYSAEPLIIHIVEAPIVVPGLPNFAFLGFDLNGSVMGGQYPPYNPMLSGPVVFIQKVEHGTGTGSAFQPIGILAHGEDYFLQHLILGTDANKNSTEENFELTVIKRPPLTSTTIRVTALRAPLAATLQTELAVSGARAPATFALVKSFFAAFLDLSISVKPLTGASTDPAHYVQAITDLITRNPIAAQVDESDIVDALVRAGADRVDLPFTSSLKVLYPDLSQGIASFRGTIDTSSLERGQASTRTIALYPGDIQVSVSP